MPSWHTYEYDIERSTPRFTSTQRWCSFEFRVSNIDVALWTWVVNAQAELQLALASAPVASRALTTVNCGQRNMTQLGDSRLAHPSISTCGCLIAHNYVNSSGQVGQRPGMFDRRTPPELQVNSDCLVTFTLRMR